MKFISTYVFLDRELSPKEIGVAEIRDNTFVNSTMTHFFEFHFLPQRVNLSTGTAHRSSLGLSDIRMCFDSPGPSGKQQGVRFFFFFFDSMSVLDRFVY